MKATNPAIQSLVNSFTEELIVLVKTQVVEELRTALGASTAIPKTRVRRSPDDLDAIKKAILGHVTKRPGLTCVELAERMQTTTREIRAPLSSLVSEGHLRKEGATRSARYFIASKAKTAPKKATTKKTAPKKATTKKK